MIKQIVKILALTSVTFITCIKPSFAGDRLPFVSGNRVVITQGDEQQGNHSGLRGRFNIPQRWAYDMDAGENQTLVATRTGFVLTKGWDPNGFGHFIVIRTNAGDDVYAHMKYASGLNIGSIVLQAQSIGVIGQTGLVTGRHVHLERFVNWQNQSLGTRVIDFDEDFNNTVAGDVLVSQNTVSPVISSKFSLLSQAVPNTTNNEQCVQADGTKIGVLPNAQRASFGPCQNIWEYRFTTLNGVGGTYLFQLEARPGSGQAYCMEVDGTKIDVLPNANAVNMAPCRDIQEQRFRTLFVENNLFLLQLEATPSNGIKQCLQADVTKIGTLPNTHLLWAAPCQNIQEFRFISVPR